MRIPTRIAALFGVAIGTFAILGGCKLFLLSEFPEITQGASLVSAPTFTPSGGLYTSAVPIVLSSSTAGAAIRYTLDGSNPDVSVGSVYVAPVSILPPVSSMTVKAVGVKGGARSSMTIATYSYAIETVAGTGANGYTGDGGPAIAEGLNHPDGFAYDSAGNLYIADSWDYRVRKVDTSGVMTTFAGTTAGFSGDGLAASSAQFNGLGGIAIDSFGNVYVSDLNNARIRRIDSTGIITTVAGNGSPAWSGDGPATSVSLYAPAGLALDAAGNLYVADYWNGCIRKVAGGLIVTVAGTGGSLGYSGDGGPATSALLGAVSDVAFDSAGNFYIADSTNNRIRRVDAATQYISTVAGNGTAGYSGDGGLAASAQLSDPTGVTVDASGNLYIADYGNHRIRRVEAATGVITTVAGNGASGYSGNGGAAPAAQLSNPRKMLIHAGYLLMTEEGNGVVRRVP